MQFLRNFSVSSLSLVHSRSQTDDDGQHRPLSASAYRVPISKRIRSGNEEKSDPSKEIERFRRDNEKSRNSSCKVQHCNGAEQ